MKKALSTRPVHVPQAPHMSGKPMPPPDPGKPLDPPGAPSSGTWFRSIMTDHNGDFDLGAVLVGVVVVFMCANAGYDTVVMHQHFDPQPFGIGIAAVLGGFAAYKWGDSKRAPPNVAPPGDSDGR